ncbi:MAG: L-ribulose-5-phosphate 3-epimerase [Clostridiales bacterium]|nr:L-ribulose-5-phosphate 3-epimerase [Clostridiales bacterium]
MNRIYRLGVYEKAMPAELDWKLRLSIAKDCGFDYLEMSIDETDERISRLDWSDDELFELLEIQKEIGLPIETVCFSAQRKFPLGSEKWEKEAKELLEKGVLFAKKLGIRIIQLQGYDVYYEETSEVTRERFYKNLEEETMFAAMHGVTLALETMETDFMNTVEKAMYSVTRVNSPYLQVYPDIGNISNAVEDVIDDIKRGMGHISAAHLKETAPGIFREVKYGSGHVDFPAAIMQLYKQGVRRYVAEFWYTGEENWKEIAEDNRKFLHRQFEKAL